MAEGAGLEPAHRLQAGLTAFEAEYLSFGAFLAMEEGGGVEPPRPSRGNPLSRRAPPPVGWPFRYSQMFTRWRLSMWKDPLSLPSSNGSNSILGLVHCTLPSRK